MCTATVLRVAVLQGCFSAGWGLQRCSSRGAATQGSAIERSRERLGPSVTHKDANSLLRPGFGLADEIQLGFIETIQGITGVLARYR